jgi:hypothetical protein
MGRRLGSGKVATEMRRLREGAHAVANVADRILRERDDEIARLKAEVDRYRSALAVISGSSDRLQAAQAICALDNIGPDVDKRT